ncbi:MAG: ATP-dependent DNA helicase [Deltaproteobacteria bacterium]|nr:ATP-dependent DNA helicase [Candidatus Zymogenaceae bacterium]
MTTIPEESRDTRAEPGIEEIFGDDGALSAVLERYEFRDGQLTMSRAVRDALVDRECLMVEAGTGTGKTLAYLAPAVLSGRKVVVSTATKNLQDQIINQDVPLLSDILDRPVTAVHLKGRRNYLCLRHYDRFIRQGTFSFKDDALLFRTVEKWVQTTQTGDRAEIDRLPDSYTPWNEICSTADTCTGANCPHHERCFVMKRRREAREADLVVVNHYLFFADLMIKHLGGMGIIPEHDAVIFDEAHHLEDVCAAYFGCSLSRFRIDELMRDLLREMGHEGVVDERVAGAAEKLTGASNTFFGDIHRRLFQSRGEGRVRMRRGFFSKEDAQNAVQLRERLTLLSDRVSGLNTDSEGILSISRRADELAADLDTFFSPPDSDTVYWCEVRGHGLFLMATPIDSGKVLRETLYPALDTLVFTSATLTVGGEFDFFARSVGLWESTDDASSDAIYEKTRGVRIAGGFDLSRQALLCIPRGLPEPSHPSFIPRISSLAERLITASQGKALVLCTSFKNMNEMYRELSERLSMPVFVQGEAPKPVLLDAFRTDVESVLCATSSFWEGVDVPGEALSLVIIDKLPFDSPSDPIIQARGEYLSMMGRNPFYTYQIPRAVIALRQGLGRLIRSASDRGALCVFDSRLYTRTYGTLFLNSLSDYRITDRPEDVEEFFTSGDGENP